MILKRLLRLSLRGRFAKLPTGTYRYADLAQARIRYRDTGGGGPVVLITPDPPNTIEHYNELIDALSSRMRVICFDLPGFGFSFPHMRFRFSPAEQEQAIVGLLDALEVETATLAFNCVASLIAVGIAARHPERVERLVLSQAPSLSDALDWAQRVDPKRVIRRGVLGQAMMMVMPRKVARGWYRVALPKGSETEPYDRPAQTMLRNGGCYCLASALQALERSTEEIASGVEVESVVLWGALDRTHRHSDPEAIKKHLPNAQVHILDHCGHFPDLEDPETFTKVLKA